jgi:hypothetical protein
MINQGGCDWLEMQQARKRWEMPILVEKSEKIFNIKMTLRETGCEGVDFR